MAKIHFIVNPLRPSIGLKWPYEEKVIAEVTSDFEVHITRGRLHSEILARKAIESGAELIVCVGGDSTLSEIVNGVYRTSQGGTQPPYVALYPGLQRGDTIRSIKPRKDIRTLLADFLRGSVDVTQVDVGEVEYTGDYGQKVRRVFLNTAGFGFSAVMADRLSRDYRRARSKFSFLRLVARLIPFYRQPEVSIDVDDKNLVVQQEILTGLLHNGAYAGHGLHLSPSSEMNDGLFDFTVIRKTFTYKYLLGIFGLYAGKLRASSFVLQGVCKEMRVTPTRPIRKVKVDFDGDTWGFLPATFRLLPGALKFIR